MKLRNHQRYSVAMPTGVEQLLRRQLLRPDRQEDLCFALWHESAGLDRTTILLADVVLPLNGERHVHGNASFESRYFLRAAQRAAEAGAGLALLHVHPGGNIWQGLSSDDDKAERSHAPRATALTGRPFVGLTLAGGSGTWSARRWTGEPGREEPRWVENVRVVGDQLRIDFNPSLWPARQGVQHPTLVRTVSAWGDEVQAILSRMNIGIVGAGSVGAIIAESLVRIGTGSILLLDFDRVDESNLDRSLHARQFDAQRKRFKVEVTADALRLRRSNPDTIIRTSTLSVVEPDGLRKALDCDLLFSCVDRPWARHVLNVAAYAHLVPVVDGGVSIDAGGGSMRGAEWRAHIAAPGRRCLECLGQVDPGMVSVERAGLLDDPDYVRNLPPGHPVLKRENVFPFAAAAATAEVLQFISMLVAPGGIADVGAQLFHFATGTLDREERSCEASCPYSSDVLARGDDTGMTITGRHSIAEEIRAIRTRTSAREHLGDFLDFLARRVS